MVRNNSKHSENSDTQTNITSMEAALSLPTHSDENHRRLYNDASPSGPVHFQNGSITANGLQDSHSVAEISPSIIGVDSVFSHLEATEAQNIVAISAFEIDSPPSVSPLGTGKDTHDSNLEEELVENLSSSSTPTSCPRREHDNDDLQDEAAPSPSSSAYVHVAKTKNKAQHHCLSGYQTSTREYASTYKCESPNSISAASSYSVAQEESISEANLSFNLLAGSQIVDGPLSTKKSRPSCL